MKIDDRDYQNPKEIEIYYTGRSTLHQYEDGSMFVLEHQYAFSFNLPYRCLEYGSSM